MVFEFLTQRIPVYAQDTRGLALVLAGILHHHLEQGFFDFVKNQAIHVAGRLAVQVPEIGLYGFPDLVTQFNAVSLRGFFG